LGDDHALASVVPVSFSEINNITVLGELAYEAAT
jgi:hypothetical protein